MMECPNSKKQSANGHCCSECGAPLAVSKPIAESIAVGSHSKVPLFMQVSIERLLLMGFITQGTYICYWIYRNWRYLKERLSLSISPVARGLFWVFFIHTLFGRINGDAEARAVKNPAFSSSVLATMTLVTALVGVGLPFMMPLFSPRDLSTPTSITTYIVIMLVIGAVSIICSFLPILFFIPVQNYINSVNSTRDPGIKNHPLTFMQYVFIAFGVLTLASRFMAFVSLTSVLMSL